MKGTCIEKPFCTFYKPRKQQSAKCCRRNWVGYAKKEFELLGRFKDWIKVQKCFKSKIFKRYRIYRPMVCIICKYFKFLALLSNKFEVISVTNSCSNNIFFISLMCYDFFSSFWLKILVYKVYLVTWRHQLSVISLSTLSEIDSYKLRNKCATFCALYKMCTIFSRFLSTNL